MKEEVKIMQMRAELKKSGKSIQRLSEDSGLFASVVYRLRYKAGRPTNRQREKLAKVL